jgi:maltose phosphorylase
VAYGIETYAGQTGDRAFLNREGAEMLVQICRYLASRGNWNQDRTAYGYYGVMGPDEFHLMVNNNFYTNYMGKKAIEYTLRVLRGLSPAEWAALQEKTGVDQAEIQGWKTCAQAMTLLKDETGRYEQHEGYFGLPHLDIHAIPTEEFPLYEHWSYDRIYRTDMIKQPDVLMAMFLYPGDFSLAEKAINYDYYEPRCIHESSLSPSIHSIFAAELGRPEEAFRFFAYATRLDLDDYNRNACDGLHTTGIAAAWMTIVMGFGGLRMNGAISLRPMLPAAWEGFSFIIRAQNSRLKVFVEKGRVTLTLLEGEALEATLYGKAVTVTEQGVCCPMP